MRSEPGFDESCPSDRPVATEEMEDSRSRSDSSPCHKMGEQGSEDKYPEPSPTAAEGSEPVDRTSPTDQLTTEKEDSQRSTRPRRRKGYYKAMLKGNL